MCTIFLPVFLLPSLREEEAIQLDGLNAAQIKELREKSEKHAFQAEVNRMMKLIINSLYKNKEVEKQNNFVQLYSFLCENLISLQSLRADFPQGADF